MEFEGYEKCNECGEWKQTDAECGNPACWEGFGAYRIARAEWEQDREAFMRRQSTSGMWMNPAAFREIFEKNNPAPKRETFAR